VLSDQSGRVVDEPFREAGGEHRRVRAGHQGVVVEYDAEVARLRIRDDAAGVVLRAESGADEVVERIPVGAGDLQDAADGLSDRGASDSGCDVIGRHRLRERRRDPHGVTVGRFMIQTSKCSVGFVLLRTRLGAEIRLAVATAKRTLGSS
jgi:hypothetical protein